MYRLFMKEYLDQANREMCEYSNRPFEESIFEDTMLLLEDNDFVFKENYYFRDHLQKTHIEGPLSKKHNRDAIVDYVGAFLNSHVKQLSTAGPVLKFTYMEKDAKFLYTLFNITPNELIKLYTEMEKETYSKPLSKFITGWVTNAPHKILITAMLVEAVQKDYKDIIECCEYLWAFAEYAILYDNSWPIGVKEDVMAYTIEHLGSKFKVTKVDNLQALLKYDTTGSVEFYLDQLKKGADNIYIDLMRRIRNQMKSTFTNIAKVYYANSQANATIHQNTSIFDDGTIADQEGITSTITFLVDKTTSKFTKKELNQGLIRACADGAQVDRSNLSAYITQIYADKNNKLNKFIENIITAYFQRNPSNSELNSAEFLNFGLMLYRSIGTSKDPLYKEIRQILDHWMFEVIDINQFYTRAATVISYTRALFNYFIFMINSYNN